ncbi:uncharacterized protein LOC9659693 [Selaginella moellendorffii]|uniref:uncharacterized protein LOC9659693 n=1 Tax=Selaginella moellendorffii TaxID=88036 RepID=UPI000D1CCF64|nr:uncharacterized protein LOC9659693 [Selaginella moellendorffii]|eukprot:XP_024530233.1 uncharacterized protein LOC9659693 [Selaginella moellendorffii]
MAMEIRCRIPDAHELSVLCVAFNNYRNEVYSGSQDCLIKVVEFGGPVYSLAWDGKGKHVIAGGKGVVQLYRVIRSSASKVYATEHIQLCPQKHSPRCLLFSCGKRIYCWGAITAVAYDKDAKTLITGSYDGSIKIWSHEGHCMDEFIGHSTPSIIDTLAPSDVTEWVADTCGIRNLPLTKGHADWVECVVLCYRKPPKISEEENQKPKKKDAANNGGPKRVTFTAVGDGPISPSSSPEPEAPVQHQTFISPTAPQIGSLLDTEIYSAGADGSILKWKPSPGNNCDSWTMHEYAPPCGSAVLCMIHDPTSDVLVTGSEDCKIRIWNLDTQPTVSRCQVAGGEVTGPDVLRGHEAKIVGLCVHNEEGMQYSPPRDEGEIAMWDPDAGCVTKTMCHKKEPVTCLFVDEINKLVLMSMLSDHFIRGFDLNMEKELCTYVGHKDQIHSLVHFPHRKQYLSGSWDSTIRAWLTPDSIVEPKPVVIRTAVEEKDVDPLQEEPLISSYEKEYPLVPPKTLQNAGPAMFPTKRPDSRETIPATGKLVIGSSISVLRDFLDESKFGVVRACKVFTFKALEATAQSCKFIAQAVALTDASANVSPK